MANIKITPKGLCFVFCAVLVLSFSSCSLFGVHYTPHNPNKPSKIPEFSKEQSMLGESNKYRMCYDVNFYQLDLEFFPEDKSIEGIVTIKGLALTDFDSLQIDLHSKLQIHEITTGDEILKFRREERAVRIARKGKVGDSIVFQVKYSGKPQVAKKAPWWGGTVWKKSESKEVWAGVACESDGASLWWPTKDVCNDEADSVVLNYTVPSVIKAVGNGKLIAVKDTLGKSTFSWKVSYPINTYNITFYLGDYIELKDSLIGVNGKKLEICHYVLPEHYSVAKDHFKQAKRIIEEFEEIFGEYPWYNDGYKLVDSPYDGMEHQTAIAYGNKFKNDFDEDTDYIILHETAHEWWGNAVSAKDLCDVWLQEGFATYAEALYAEAVSSKKDYSNEIYWSSVMIKNKIPVAGVCGKRWFDANKNSDVYGKGAQILATLREQMDNDDLFFKILRGFYSKYKYGIVETGDFIGMVNSVTGKDYDWLINHYVYRHYIPSLDVYIDDHGVVFYRWSKKFPLDDEFNKFRVVLENMGELHDVYPTDKWQTLQLKFNEANNHWEYELIGDSYYEYNKLKHLE